MTFCFKGRFQSRSHCYNARLRGKHFRWISEESTIEGSDSRGFGYAKSGTRAENERKVEKGGVDERKNEVSAIEPKDCECTLRLNIDANLLKWWNPIFFCGLKFRRETKREGKNTLARRGGRETVRGGVELVDFSRRFVSSKLETIQSEFFFNIQTVTCLGITRWLVGSF